MAGKRGNERSQLSKEDFDLVQDAEGDELKHGIRKANNSTMNKRRIIKVSRKAAWAPKPAAPPQTKNASNPFANVGLTSQSTATFPAPKPVLATQTQRQTNPFEKISLVAPLAPLPNASHNNSAEPRMPTISSVPKKFPCKADKLKFSFFSFIEEDGIKEIFFDDWDIQTNHFIKHAASVEEKERIMLEKKKITVPATTLGNNSFHSAPSASTPTIAFGSVTQTQAPSAPSTSKVFNGFHFASKSTPVTAVPAAAAPTSQDEDGFPKEKQEEALSESNPDEDCLYEVKAKHFIRHTDEWKNHGVGKLRVYQHKTQTSKRRFVMRNTVGKVQLNVGLSKGMTFQKLMRKKNAAVQFFTVLEQGKAPTMVMICVTHNDIDELFGHLERMTK